LSQWWAYAINERVARRIEYLLEEVRVLREVYTETAGRKRVPFTDEQRRRPAIKGKALTPEEREGISRSVFIKVWVGSSSCRDRYLRTTTQRRARFDVALISVDCSTSIIEEQREKPR